MCIRDRANPNASLAVGKEAVKLIGRQTSCSTVRRPVHTVEDAQPLHGLEPHTALSIAGDPLYLLSLLHISMCISDRTWTSRTAMAESSPQRLRTSLWEPA